MRDLLSQLLAVLYEDGPQLLPTSDCLSRRGLCHSLTHRPISFQAKSRPSDWPWLGDRPGHFPQLATTQKVNSALKVSVGSAELLLGATAELSLSLSCFPSLILPQVICLHWLLGEPHLWHLFQMITRSSACSWVYTILTIPWMLCGERAEISVEWGWVS